MGPGMFDGFDKVLIVLAVFAIIGVIFGVENRRDFDLGILRFYLKTR
jgi:putative exporter of polyketide antibiotics